MIPRPVSNSVIFVPFYRDLGSCSKTGEVCLHQAQTHDGDPPLAADGGGRDYAGKTVLVRIPVFSEGCA